MDAAMKSILDKIDLERAVWGDIKELKYDLVVLPWGAIEPHNYHLPYTTDCYLSQNIALDSAVKAYKNSGVLTAVMSPIFLGSQNPGQWNLPLCIHANSETQKAILEDTIVSLQRQGFNKLVIINGHGGNSFKPYVRDFAMKYPDFKLLVVDWWSFISPKGYFEEQPDEHAGELETSVMLHYRPNLVKMDLAGDGKLKPTKLKSVNEKVAWIPRNWSEVTEDTGIGNPHKATAEKGARFAEHVTDKIARMLEELAKL